MESNYRVRRPLCTVSSDSFPPAAPRSGRSRVWRQPQDRLQMAPSIRRCPSPRRFALVSGAGRSLPPARHSPTRTDLHIQRLILDVRDRFNWGPRKIHAFLLQQAQRDGAAPPLLPSVRTVGSILARTGRVQPAAAQAPLQRFEREQPNQLWQLDHKGPIEVQRQKITPLAVIDDHSRYCLAFACCRDRTTATAFAILWELFQEVGLPDSILCDNAFNAAGAQGPGLSWFDSRLIRLGIRPIHGRPYHPQTQGKCERWHGTAVREFIFFNARRDRRDHFEADSHRWRDIYNTLRPHQSLGDRPPIERWRPSPRPCPATLPPLLYQPGQITRIIGTDGQIYYRGYRILVSRALVGERVAVDEDASQVQVLYSTHRVRCISLQQLIKDKLL